MKESRHEKHFHLLKTPWSHPFYEKVCIFVKIYWMKKKYVNHGKALVDSER